MGPQEGPQKLGLPGEDSVDGRGTLSSWPQVADDHHAFHEDAKSLGVAGAGWIAQEPCQHLCEISRYGADGHEEKNADDCDESAGVDPPYQHWHEERVDHSHQDEPKHLV